MDGNLPPPTGNDLIHPFQLENEAARGRVVRLDRVVAKVIANQDYPEPVARLLGELLALAALVSSALKFDGVFTLQAKGAGPVSLLLADVTTAGAMRGYAQYDAERLAEARAEAGAAAASPVPHYLGTGYLAFTVDQGPETDRYQGIVELAGATLADCAHLYFRQSDQLDAVVKLAAGPSGARGGRWRAAGMMVQRLPGQGRALMSGEAGDENMDDAWRRAVILMASSTPQEMLDAALHPHELLYRLFHEDGVRVFEPQRLEMRCRCSKRKVTTMLRSFPRAEIDSLKIGDAVVVTCEFCGKSYRFDDAALDWLYGT